MVSSGSLSIRLISCCSSYTDWLEVYMRTPSPSGSATADRDAKRLAMQKMAFEVAWRIQRVTPVNATALVSALLLATRGLALTLGRLLG